MLARNLIHGLGLFKGLDSNMPYMRRANEHLRDTNRDSGFHNRPPRPKEYNPHRQANLASDLGIF